MLCLVAAQRPKPDITGERTVAAETTLPIPWSGPGFSRFLPDDLPWEIRRGDATPADPAPFHLPPNGIDLTALEAELIRQALGMAAGNKSRAARLLGLTRDTLLYRMEKHLIKA